MTDSVNSQGTIPTFSCCCSLTAVRQGQVLFNVMLNYLSQQIFVACSLGIYHASISRLGNDRFDKLQWKRVTFPPTNPRHHERLIAYLRHPDYLRNLKSSRLMNSWEKNLEDFDVPGPGRILFLSSLSDSRTGAILANGEKAAEWLGWLAFAGYAKDRDGFVLSAYRITTDSPTVRKGALMAPGKDYSILETGNAGTWIDLERLRHFGDPSRYRETILITHKTNTLMASRALAHGYRELVLHPDQSVGLRDSSARSRWAVD